MSSEAKGLIFIVLSAISGIGTILPGITLEKVEYKETTYETYKMVGTVWGVIGLVAAALCIFLVVSGMKDKCGFASAILAITGLINGFTFYINREKLTTMTSSKGLGQLFSALTDDNVKLSVTMSWGFYVYCFATALAVIAGIAYTVSKD